MWKRLLPGIIMFVLLFGASTASSAKSTHPAAVIDCSGGCSSQQAWGQDGTYNVHGASTQTLISSPPVSSSGYSWNSQLDVVSTSDSGYAFFGLDKLGQNTRDADCTNNSSTPTLYYYWAVTNSSGTLLGGTPKCVQVNGTDVNKYINIQIGNYTSNGGGTLIVTHNGASDTPCESGCFFSGGDQTFGLIFLTDLVNDIFSGHYQWGIDWTSNRYQSLTGTWAYQSHSCSDGDTACLTHHLPPAMFWFTSPEHSAIGGDLYNCIYDNNLNSCTLGS